MGCSLPQGTPNHALTIVIKETCDYTDQKYNPVSYSDLCRFSTLCVLYAVVVNILSTLNILNRHYCIRGCDH